MSTPQIQMAGGPAQGQRNWSAKGFIRFGLICVLILGGGFGGWAATASLSGAVIAMGQLRVQSNKQVVQHPDGGVVGAIMVRDGDVVEAGSVLLRLDDKLRRAELAGVESQLYEIMARRGRLEAVITGASKITFDPELVERASTDKNINALMEGQRALLAAQRNSHSKQYAILGERIAQLRVQIEGTEAQIQALIEQTELIGQELTDKEKLLKSKHIRVSEVLALKREQSRLAGQAGELRARVGQLKGQITEAEIEQSRLATSRLEEAIAESRELGFRELEQKQRQASLQEQLARLDIRAPKSGTVIENTVFALKSVIRPADPIMYIVPNDTDLIIEARVEPTDIDVIHVGQDATLRLSALNSRTTPELFGEVVTKSADVSTDEQTGLSYYRLELRLKAGEVEKLEGQELVAGMPVEVYVQTGKRTPLEYMVKPISDYFNRALREG